MNTTTTRKPRAPKLSTLETRAARFCAAAREAITRGETVPLALDWRDNREGIQAVALDAYGAPMARTGGGGYCKESTALADSLRFLGSTEAEQHEIHKTGGAGPRSTIAALATQGIRLRHVAHGKKFDAYELAPLAD